jgi:small subunit ribosomal protein S17
VSAEENNDEQSEAPEVEPEVSAADAPAEQADEAPAEEAPAEEPAAEDAAADDAPAEEATPAAPAPADDGEDVEALTPKQQRKLDRARHAGEPRPPRDPEERATERAATRAKAAAARTRSRARARTKHEPGQGTPPAEHAPGSKKVRQGTVVSSKADKTITVRIEVVRRHPVYEKVVRRTATIHVHDEANDANAGDIVRVIESRPLSRTKRWRLVEVLERAR